MGSSDVQCALDRLINREVPETEALRHINLMFDWRVPEDAYRKRVAERTSQAAVVAGLPKGIAQRTPEWYSAREGLITASNFGDAASRSDAARRSFVRRKVCPKPFLGSEATRWGVKYEDLAAALYEHYTGAKVGEYGLLIHPTEKHLGASPDGITAYGVMVEIKCPFSKTLNDIPPDYAAQMQGQLEVCDLEVCDFVVCRVREVDDPATFWALRGDGDPARLGAAAERSDDAGGFDFSSPSLTDDQLKTFIDTAEAAGRRVTLHHAFGYRVERVRRDIEGWSVMQEKLRDTWADILAAQASGVAPPPPEDARPPQFKGFSFKLV